MLKTSIGEIITKRHDFAKGQQQDLFDDFARYRQMWKSKIEDPTDYPWDYALFNPMVFSTVRSFVSRVASGNVGVTLQAWNEQGRPKTQINKQLLDWEFREAQLFLQVARAMHSVALYGKAFLSTGWLFEKARVVEEEDVEGNVVRRVTMSPTVNRADLGFVRVFDVLIANRNEPELQKQPWIIRPLWMTVDEMERINEARGEEVYKRKALKKIKDRKPFTNFVDYGQEVMNDSEGYEKAWKTGVVPVLRMQDRTDGRVYEMVRGESDLVLRKEDNPFYHGEYDLVDVTFFPDGEDFWSTGLVRPIEDLQVAENSVLNQYLTNARQQLNNMWIQGNVSIPDWEFVSRPNGVIHTGGDISQLREVEHKDITGQALEMQSKIEQMVQRTTGINDFLAYGQTSEGNSTASGLQLEQNNLDQNLRLFMTMLESVTLTKLATQFLKLNQQYITSEQIIGIAGRHGYKHASIKPEEVSAEFTPIVIPNSTLPKNPLLRLQNLENLKAMADKEQKVDVNTAPIWQEMVSLLGMTDLDEIVPSDRDEALEENELLKKGVPVECEVSDNHDTHIVIHQYELVKGTLDPESAARFLEHIKTHKLWKMSADPDLLDKFSGDPATQPGGEIGPALPDPLNPAAAATAPQASPQSLQRTTVPVDEMGLIDQLGQQLRRAGEGPTPPVPFPNVGGELSG